MDIFKAGQKMEQLKDHQETYSKQSHTRPTDSFEASQKKFADMRIHYKTSHGSTDDMHTQTVIQLMPISDFYAKAAGLQAEYNQYELKWKEINQLFDNIEGLEDFVCDHLSSSDDSMEESADDSASTTCESASPVLPAAVEEESESEARFTKYRIDELDEELSQLKIKDLNIEALESSDLQKLIHLYQFREDLPDLKESIADSEALQQLKTLDEKNMSLQLPLSILKNALRNGRLPDIPESMSIYFLMIEEVTQAIFSEASTNDEFLNGIKSWLMGPIIISPLDADNHGGPGPVQLTLENGLKLVVKFRPGTADVCFMNMLRAINCLEGTSDLPFYEQRFLDNRFLLSEYVEGATFPLTSTVLDIMKSATPQAKKKFLKLEYISRMTGLTDMHPENYKLKEGTIYPIDLESYNPESVTGFLDSPFTQIGDAEKIAFFRDAGLTDISEPEQLYIDSFAEQLFVPDKFKEIKAIIELSRQHINRSEKRFVPVSTVSFLELWAKEENDRKAALFTLLTESLKDKFEYDPQTLTELCGKILNNPPGYVPMFLLQENSLFYNTTAPENLVGVQKTGALTGR